jgi:hypothetical protein
VPVISVGTGEPPLIAGQEEAVGKQSMAAQVVGGYALAQADDLATTLAAYDETRRAVGNEVAAYGRRLWASFV